MLQRALAAAVDDLCVAPAWPRLQALIIGAYIDVSAAGPPIFKSMKPEAGKGGRRKGISKREVICADEIMVIQRNVDLLDQCFSFADMAVGLVSVCENALKSLVAGNPLFCDV